MLPPPKMSRPLLLAWALSARAQSPTGTSSAPVATHTVAVGEAGLVFTPNVIFANVSDVVEFRFYPQNHSVARAEYRYPCIPYEDTGVSKTGFWSGFHPVNIVLPDPPKFSVVVNDTSPVFFYCSAPGACTGDGMVGVINPNATQTFETQEAYAKNATVAFSPGEGFPAESTTAPASTSAPSSTSAPAPSTTAPVPVGAATPSAAASPLSAMSGGEIAGIALGAVSLLVLIALLFYVCGRMQALTQVFNLQHRGPLSPALPGDEKLRHGDASSIRYLGGHSRGPGTDRSQTHSPSPGDDEARDYSYGLPPIVEQSAASPMGERADGGIGTAPLRVNRPAPPHELAVPTRNNSQTTPLSATPRPYSLIGDQTTVTAGGEFRIYSE